MLQQHQQEKKQQQSAQAVHAAPVQCGPGRPCGLRCPVQQPSKPWARARRVCGPLPQGKTMSKESLWEVLWFKSLRACMNESTPQPLPFWWSSQWANPLGCLLLRIHVYAWKQEVCRPGTEGPPCSLILWLHSHVTSQSDLAAAS